MGAITFPQREVSGEVASGLSYLVRRVLLLRHHKPMRSFWPYALGFLIAFSFLIGLLVWEWSCGPRHDWATAYPVCDFWTELDIPPRTYPSDRSEGIAEAEPLGQGAQAADLHRTLIRSAARSTAPTICSVMTMVAEALRQPRGADPSAPRRC